MLVPVRRLSAPNADETYRSMGSRLQVVQLHPLVLINVSDHHTRVRAQCQQNKRVIGCLLGKHKGRMVEVANSFELANEGPGGLHVDTAFLLQRQEQYKQTFGDLELLGWYSTGKDVGQTEMEWNKTIAGVCENPMCLLLDPECKSASRGLPVKIYLTEMRVVGGVPTNVLIQSAYEIEAIEAERIAIDQVSKILQKGQSGVAGQVSMTLSNLQSAMLLLRKRVAGIQSVLQAMHTGAIPYDFGLVRQVRGLMQSLPAISTSALKESLLTECNDTLLITYLASLTQQAQALYELTEKVGAIGAGKFSKRRQLLGAF